MNQVQRCAKCQREKPHTIEFFRRRAINDGGAPLVRTCLVCEGRKAKWRTKPEKNPEHMSRFEVITEAMERDFGPMIDWTREVHREHTRRLASSVGMEGVLDTRVLPPGVPVSLPVDYSDPMFRAPAVR
jgi:hypothetical protein